MTRNWLKRVCLLRTENDGISEQSNSKLLNFGCHLLTTPPPPLDFKDFRARVALKEHATPRFSRCSFLNHLLGKNKRKNRCVWNLRWGTTATENFGIFEQSKGVRRNKIKWLRNFWPWPNHPPHSVRVRDFVRAMRETSDSAFSVWFQVRLEC